MGYFTGWITQFHNNVFDSIKLVSHRERRLHLQPTLKERNLQHQLDFQLVTD